MAALLAIGWLVFTGEGHHEVSGQRVPVDEGPTIEAPTPDNDARDASPPTPVEPVATNTPETREPGVSKRESVNVETVPDDESQDWALDLAQTLRSESQTSGSDNGWFIVTQNSRTVAIDTAPDASGLVVLDISGTSGDSRITEAGIIQSSYDDGPVPAQTFVDWQGNAYESKNFVVDADGVVAAVDGRTATNIETGEIQPADADWLPPYLWDMAPAPFAAIGDGVFEWSWDDGWQRLVPGGIAMVQNTPDPAVVVRSACPDRTDCALTSVGPFGTFSPLPNAPGRAGHATSISPDGTRVFQPSASQGAVIYGPDGDLELPGLDTRGAYLSAWSPSGDLLAVVISTTVFVFSTGDGRELANVHIGGSSSLPAIAFVDIEVSEP